MKGMVKSIVQLGMIWMICFGLFNLQPAWASEGNIDATYKYAWSENSGWENFRPTHGGVTVNDTYLSGYAWAENIGWVKLGSGTGPYGNTTSANWGVNHDSATGDLSGYAWSENVGWINFNPTHSQVTIDTTTLKFSDYAWAENVGWVHFQNATPEYYVKQEAAAPTITTQAVTGIGLTTATGNGNIMDLGTPNPTQHGVCWNTTDTPTLADNSTNEGAASSTGPFTSNMTGLSPNTTYYVRAYATNTAGTSYGGEVSFTTLPNPPSAPTATAATSIAETSFCANWDAATGATGYRLDVSTQSSFSSYVTGYQNKNVGNVTTNAVTGLSGGTTYYYRVRAENGSGTSGNSNTISVTTLTLPTKVILTGPSTVTAGSISTAFTLTSQDAEGNTSNVTQDTVFSLTSNSSGTKVFYSDAGGTSVITEVTISNGTSTATFYYKDSDTGTPALTAKWDSGGTNLESDTHQVTVSLAATTLATSTSVALSFKDFKITVTKIEMNNGTSWVTIFSGTAELDLVNGGTFQEISDLVLPSGTYNEIRVTFRNSLPVTGMLSYSGTDYYTTTATFGGESNVASNPTSDPGGQTVFTFRIDDWGAVNADVIQTYSITPVTVDPITDYQPTLRFTISNTLLFKGTAGTASTYYFTLGVPTASIVEP